MSSQENHKTPILSFKAKAFKSIKELYIFILALQK